MQLLATSKNNVDVYIDLDKSHAITHIQKHPNLLDYARQIINGHEILADEDRFETDMGFIVGTTDLVETTDKDEIVYAQRPNRDKFNRFVKNRISENTNIVTMDIRKGLDNRYFVYTIYIGKNTPKSPGGDREDPDSREFWNKHALVWGNQDTVSGTETTICPW
jgi:hypothetical protein